MRHCVLIVSDSIVLGCKGPLIFCLFLDPNSAVSEKVDVVLARKAVEGALGVNANADVAERSAREIESFMVILILILLVLYMR